MLLHVGPGIEEQAVAGQAVATRAPHLLIPGLDVLREIAVDDEAHVRLVDPHPERDGRHHHVHLVAPERLLIARALLVRQAGVVGHRAHAVGAQIGGRLVHRAAREAVDDPALPRGTTLAHQREDLAAGFAVPLLAAADPQVRPEERALEAGRLAHPELSEDVGRDGARGGGGERQRRHVEMVAEALEAPVRGTEVVAPLADAVRFVHHHERERAALEEVAHASLERLGGHVHELVLARLERGEAPAALLGVERRVDLGGAEAQRLELVHLILHQADQRRQHQHCAAEETRGELEGERLARAGGHERDAVASLQDRLDDLPLPGAEGVVAEVQLEGPQKGIVERVAASRCTEIEG